MNPPRRCCHLLDTINLNVGFPHSKHRVVRKQHNGVRLRVYCLHVHTNGEQSFKAWLNEIRDMIINNTKCQVNNKTKLKCY